MLGLQRHLAYHHGTKSHRCDICFQTFGFKYQKQRHRAHHFGPSGSLKESAIIVHRLHRQRLGLAENLSGELRQAVEEYERTHNLQPVCCTTQGQKVDDLAAAGVQQAAAGKTASGETNTQEVALAPAEAETLTAGSKTEHRCPVCHMCYISKVALTRHFKSVHSSGQASKAKKATASVRKQLKQMVTEADILECPHCNKSATAYRTLHDT